MLSIGVIEVFQSADLPSTGRRRIRASNLLLWLVGTTLLWKVLECGLSLYSAALAHSAAMLAFGSDSLVELLSALAVLSQFFPRYAISVKVAGRLTGALLYVLAVIVGATAVVALAMHLHPDVTYLGISVTLASAVAMPALATMKRKEARRSGNIALAADAVQSATCAYLALIALTGLAVNALFHIAWLDCAAALAAIPVLIKEGREAWRGDGCGFV